MEFKFTGQELRIMEQFWKSERVSIREILETFPKKRRPPYTSVQTIVYR
jgi:predicted transcriptional regulator